MNMILQLADGTISPIITESFPIIRIILMIILSVLAIVLVACILFQQGNSEGIGAISGGSDTFFGKNKGQTLEGKLRKITVWVSVSMAVISVLFFITVIIYPLQ